LITRVSCNYHIYFEVMIILAYFIDKHAFVRKGFGYRFDFVSFGKN